MEVVRSNADLSQDEQRGRELGTPGRVLLSLSLTLFRSSPTRHTLASLS